MTKSDSAAIILLADAVNALTKRCKTLESSIMRLFKENDKLRAENRRLLGRCNELDGVNT